jgi:small subunit ribosomal protein S1
MYPKRTFPNVESEVPEMDEGWWSAILAEEDASTDPSKEGSAKAKNLSRPLSVDWDHVRTLHEQDEIVVLRVEGFNRGGLLVQGDDIQGFVPVSHLVDMPCGVNEEERIQVFKEYLGRSLRLKVIECEPSQDRIVFSERAALAGEGQRKYLFACLKPGDVVSGTVTNVTEFGVFVDLGGLEGLIHVSELSWGRVQHPKYITKVGQVVDTMVLQVTEETARVALSIKRLQPNPWETFASRYKIGDLADAIITNIMRFGAFARLEEGIEGLIHISSVNLQPGQKSLEEVFQAGQSVHVKVLHLDVERRRLGLGLVETE